MHYIVKLYKIEEKKFLIKQIQIIFLCMFKLFRNQSYLFKFFTINY